MAMMENPEVGGCSEGGQVDRHRWTDTGGRTSLVELTQHGHAAQDPEVWGLLRGRAGGQTQMDGHRWTDTGGRTSLIELAQHAPNRGESRSLAAAWREGRWTDTGGRTQVDGHHSSSWHSMATPRRIQKSGGCSEGRSTAMTKLVECPVEESMPARPDVRYRGHS